MCSNLLIPKQAYEKDPAAGFGWGGKLDSIYVLLPLLPGLLLSALWFVKSFRKRIAGKLTVLAGMVLPGIAAGMLLWYIYSNMMIDDVLQARSFSFFLPVSFPGAFVILCF